MATKKKPSNTKRAPFIERFNNRVTKLKSWIAKTQPRFASAPSSDVSDALGAVDDSLDAIIDAVKALKTWAPPTRSPAFAVGDNVSFKKGKIDELVKMGFYKKSDLEGTHTIQAIAGRKVKLEAGVFQSLYVTKSAA